MEKRVNVVSISSTSLLAVASYLAVKGFWALRDNIYECVTLEPLPW
jgi:hypothetical protein